MKLKTPDWKTAVTEYTRANRPERIDWGEPYRGQPRARRVVPWFAWLTLGVVLGVAAVVSGGAL